MNCRQAAALYVIRDPNSAMLNQFDTIRQLTSGRLSEVERSSKLNEFAYELGWRGAPQIVPADLQ